MHVRIGRLSILTLTRLITPAIAGETIRVMVDKLKFDPPKSRRMSATRSNGRAATLSSTRRRLETRIGM